MLPLLPFIYLTESLLDFCFALLTSPSGALKLSNHPREPMVMLCTGKQSLRATNPSQDCNPDLAFCVVDLHVFVGAAAHPITPQFLEPGALLLPSLLRRLFLLVPQGAH